MSFFASLGAGFLKDQNNQMNKQQSDQDKMSELGFANILKNVNSYNTEKAAYTKDSAKAKAWSAASAMPDGGFAVSQDQAYNMITMGLKDPEGAIAEARRNYKPGTPAPATTLADQTNTAIGATPATTPDASISATAPNAGTQTASTPTSQPNYTGGSLKPTLIDSIIGTDPNVAVNRKVQGMASAVTGLTSQGLAAAATGHFTAPSNPSAGFPFSMQDKEGIKDITPDKYLTNASYQQAIQKANNGDYTGARALMATKDQLINAETSAQQQRSQFTAPSEHQKDAQALVDNNALDENGKPYTLATALTKLTKVNKGDEGSQFDGIMQSGLNGNDFLKAVSDKDPHMANVVKSVAQGRVQFVGNYALTKPAGQELLSLVQQYDPKFQSADANARYRMTVDMASQKAGTSGLVVTANNQIMPHLLKLDQAAKDLGNGNFSPLTYLKNRGKDVTSDPKYTTFNTSVTPVAEEMERLMRGASGSTESINNWRKNFDVNKGYQSNHAAALSTLSTIAGKMDAFADSYNRVMGTNRTGLDFMAPASLDAYAQIKGITPDHLPIKDGTSFLDTEKVNPNGIYQIKGGLTTGRLLLEQAQQ